MCVETGSWATRRGIMHPPSREATVVRQNRRVSDLPSKCPFLQHARPLPQVQKLSAGRAAFRFTIHEQERSTGRVAADAARRHERQISPPRRHECSPIQLYVGSWVFFRGDEGT